MFLLDGRGRYGCFIAEGVRIHLGGCAAGSSVVILDAFDMFDILCFGDPRVMSSSRDAGRAVVKVRVDCWNKRDRQ